MPYFVKVINQFVMCLIVTLKCFFLFFFYDKESFLYSCIALNKREYQVFFYFCMKTCCRYSLEVPSQGTSNVYLQHVFIEK